MRIVALRPGRKFLIPEDLTRTFRRLPGVRRINGLPLAKAEEIFAAGETHQIFFSPGYEVIVLAEHQIPVQ